MIQIPPMPRLEDFPGSEYGYNNTLYKDALTAWERVACEVIRANVSTSNLLMSVKRDIEVATKRMNKCDCPVCRVALTGVEIS